MSNPFLSTEHRDIETALLLEKAVIHDLGDRIACTDGSKVYINTDDNLNKLLPAYNEDMLKWLLWHERYHEELRHHKRYFEYVEKLNKTNLDKTEVNIIMDILVHDSLEKMFPDITPTAKLNMAQLRSSNSLDYDFKTFTLEEMLDEYSKYKDETDGSSSSETGKTDDSTDGTDGIGTKAKDTDTSKTDTDEMDETDGTAGERKGHAASSSDNTPSKDTPKDTDMIDTSEKEHTPVDWSKLKNIDTSSEFLDEIQAYQLEKNIYNLRNTKIRLAQITETINGLITSSRKRTYAKPSSIYVGKGVILKGSTPSRAKLYLCFDASGSMGSEMEMFKEVISNSIPQAMQTDTAWFSGAHAEIAPDPDGKNCDYYKGKFKDFMPIRANSGYEDDGDRTIELCYLAEQQGYSPIGVTDGGGKLSWSVDMLKQLKRTIIVSPNKYWLKSIKSINPTIQIIPV